MILFVMVLALPPCFALFLETTGNDICVFGSELLNGSEGTGERETWQLKIGGFSPKSQQALWKFLIFLVI